ncbi:hypothetical protein [Pseudomonas chlororaphis]|uniref:hypothetical protein n=1 Tax=Pseudomonas chlororaphis TaxID=587753 RepID=UPI001B30E453|nr:hypothetical protein [Pseudomonas chlororaphis]MBP5053738.1 hypothetical protein [Pseudomonas chlororaphis]MBP5142378.1 hypothetical protein [Pseudomonas chlororaphis]QTU00911.1 hypothetical protein HUT26_16990 [Pseudomonas chlororaphis]
MRLEQMPYHSVPTVALLPFRQFEKGWSWQLRALKLFPDALLAWKHHFVDNGQGHAKGQVFRTYTEAIAVADEFNEHFQGRVRQAIGSADLQASTILKVEKALTSGRRIRDEEELMEQEALRRNASQPRPSAVDLELPRRLEALRVPLSQELNQAPYLQLIAFPKYDVCLRRKGDLEWEYLSRLNTKLSQFCFRERIARGFGLSGADHWGRTKAQIRAALLPRANQLLQQASVVQMLADARACGQRVVVCGGFVFWYEEDGVPRWVIKNTGGESNSAEGTTLWHEGTILSKNHGRIVVLPYIKENGECVQGHTKNAPHDGKALPRHPDQYVTLPFEILDGDLMIGLFGELPYE